MKFASRTISPVRVCLPVRVICSKVAVPSLISLPNFQGPSLAACQSPARGPTWPRAGGRPATAVARQPGGRGLTGPWAEPLRHRHTEARLSESAIRLQRVLVRSLYPVVPVGTRKTHDSPFKPWSDFTRRAQHAQQPAGPY